ncbi:predicted protein [Uncinocarpus reesii 1704]|uniref:Glutathione S-transferase n=1 Tax=Uncinocarpus reesii (strain UAMH 1704) TaxID=336963 RepID=C4JQ23_UNCRE|nr:uncharacterized protein UREG_03256 [Uncinocarpus reesii 1704]EEP78410.1 predicted protein [Uncinocarpus reesii 1704]
MASTYPAHLHHAATGSAKKLADEHSGEQPLKLYAGWFFQRTWIVLEEKKIPYQYIEVNPYDKPASLLSLNPRGLVPTLHCPQPGGQAAKPLYESNIINEYLDDAYPDHTPRFLPSDPYERARAKIWIDFASSKIVPGFHRFLRCQDEEGISKARAEFLGYLKEFTLAMDDEGPYFLGKGFMMPDVVLAPWAMRLWSFEQFKGGLGIPDPGQGGPDEEVWQRWRRWLAAVTGRRSVQDVMSDREHYLPIYKRFADNLA